MRTLLASTLVLVSTSCASAPPTEGAASRWNGREGASSGAMSHLDAPPAAGTPVAPIALSLTHASDPGRSSLPPHAMLADGVVETSQPIAPGQTLQGSLSAGGMRVSDGAAAADYVFFGQAGDHVIAELHGGALASTPGTHMDMYLYLLLDDHEVTHDDDGGGNLDSRIDLVLPGTGLYTLRATTYAGVLREGAYSISLQRGE